MARLRQHTPTLHIPLRRVGMCLDCEACFELGPNSCPACGSETWTAIARFVGSGKSVARAVEALIDETRDRGARAPAVRHLLIVAHDRVGLYEMLARELEGNPSLRVVRDRRTTARGARLRDRRSRNIDSQLRALGWAIVRAESPAAAHVTSPEAAHRSA